MNTRNVRVGRRVFVRGEAVGRPGANRIEARVLTVVRRGGRGGKTRLRVEADGHEYWVEARDVLALADPRPGARPRFDFADPPGAARAMVERVGVTAALWDAQMRHERAARTDTRNFYARVVDEIRRMREAS